jgi:hypothetical protein
MQIHASLKIDSWMGGRSKVNDVGNGKYMDPIMNPTTTAHGFSIIFGWLASHRTTGGPVADPNPQSHHNGRISLKVIKFLHS